MKTETVLVTGGAGFIGSNLADELIRRGAKVKILDNFVTGFQGKLE
jgi:nucleoside-diphosphate-sugar epimerase